MLRDVAMGHPHSRMRDVEENVNGLTGRDEHRVLPDKVGFHDTVARQHQYPGTTWFE